MIIIKFIVKIMLVLASFNSLAQSINDYPPSSGLPTCAGALFFLMGTADDGSSPTAKNRFESWGKQFLYAARRINPNADKDAGTTAGAFFNIAQKEGIESAKNRAFILSKDCAVYGQKYGVQIK
jgi:hypothetical protein